MACALCRPPLPEVRSTTAANTFSIQNTVAKFVPNESKRNSNILTYNQTSGFVLVLPSESCSRRVIPFSCMDCDRGGRRDLGDWWGGFGKENYFWIWRELCYSYIFMQKHETLAILGLILSTFYSQRGWVATHPRFASDSGVGGRRGFGIEGG